MSRVLGACIVTLVRTAPCVTGKAFYIILAGMVNVNVRVEDCTKLEDINMVGCARARPLT